MEFAIAEAENGRVVFTCRPDESAYNPIGAIHGGLICTLLDSVTGCAVHSTVTDGRVGGGAGNGLAIVVAWGVVGALSSSGRSRSAGAVTVRRSG